MEQSKTETITPTEHHLAADLHGILSVLRRQGVSPERVGQALARMLRSGHHHDTHGNMRRITNPLVLIVAEVEVEADRVEEADARLGEEIAHVRASAARWSAILNGSDVPLALLGNGQYATEVMP